MAPGLEQSQNLSLHQVLAPHLQQSLQILQAPTLELRSMIQQELETNPVLEEDVAAPETDQQKDDPEFEEDFQELSKLDEEWRDYMAQSGSIAPRHDEEEERRREFLMNSLTSRETLQQHLLTQLQASDLSAYERELGETVIGNIDDAGYLQATAEQMALSTGMASADYHLVIETIRRFDPPGVAATDLRECLLLQLDRLGHSQSLEARIIADHIDLLGRHKYPDLAKKLGVPVEQIQRAANAIARLNPKPGIAFSPEPDHYVLPDVSVEKVGEDYVVSINNDRIPHLRISNLYKDIVAEGGREAREYIREKIRSGKFLIKSIHQRQQTIMNIAVEIVARQGEFLQHGPSALKPLTMAQVADIIGVHETTVSRAISGKYIATPRGTFEMKYFFTPGYTTAAGQSLSNTSVKEAIVELVRGENPREPLSDSEIVEILSERGIPIARRTVAKYRGEANILPSHMRRTY